MKTRLILSLGAVALALGPGVALAQLFSENFDVNATANWSINSGATDDATRFFFDYSSVGIPPAPNSAGTTFGMKLQANLFNETFGGYSVSPTGEVFTGDYTVSFDVWSNYNGPLALGGDGSTNLSTYGILTSGTFSNSPGFADGVYFGATGDGGSGADWRAYSPDAVASYPTGDPVYSDPSRNHTGDTYQVFGGVAAPAEQVALFPQQTETTRVGTAGMEWHEVSIFKSADIVTWLMDGTVLATVDTSGMALGGDNIMFGHSDINSTSSADLNRFDLLFTLIDNVEVTVGVPNPPPTWSRNGSGDWNASGNWLLLQGLTIPNDNTATAIFGDAITQARTVFTESDVTVKTIRFDNLNEYAIAGNGSINLEAAVGNARIDVLQGSHQFQAVVNLASAADIDVAAGALLAFNNALNLAGNDVNKTGDGTLQINNALNSGGGTVNGLAGTISGVGLVSGDLVNTGATVAPGNSPGTLSVGGSYTQAGGGTLQIEVGGLAQDAEYDLLAVGSAAALAGTVEVVLIDAFAPSFLDAFAVVTAATVDGVFSSVDESAAVLGLSPKGAQMEWLTDYGHAGVMELLVGVRGDMELDGDLDFDDITPFVGALTNAAAYLAAYGHGGSAAGDMDKDGDLDFDDIPGLVAGLTGNVASQSVPEPSSFLLAALGLVALAGCRRRHPSPVVGM